MADNTKYTGLTNYANYHTFSKLQVGNNVNFGGSINRSGHTVTNTDAWLDDVPFFNTFTTPSAALAAVGKSAVKNDLVSIAVAEGDIAVGIYRRNDVDNTTGDKTFTEIFAPYTIGTDTKDGAAVLLNKDDKAVVRVWNKQTLTLLDGANNSNANSEGQAARIIIDGTPVEQFIAVPDVCRSGYPSNGYAIKVYNDGTAMTMDFGTVTNTFFDVPFAGVIMFGGGTDGSVYTIDCFEYIGDKLAAVNTKIADINETIKGLTIEAGTGIKEIKEGTGIKVDATDPIKPTVSVDTTVIATAASVQEVATDVAEIQKTIEEGVVSTVTASTAAQAAGVTVTEGTTPEINVTVGTIDTGVTAVVTGGAVKTYVDTAASGLQNQIDDITESLATGDIHAEIDAVRQTAEAAKKLADTSAQSAEGDDYVTASQTGNKITVSTDIDAIDSKLADVNSEVGAAIKAADDKAVAANNAAAQALTDAKKYTDDEIDKVEKSIADALDAHSQDITKVEEAISSLSTSGFARIVVSELPTADIKLNAIYLVPLATAEKDENVYAEYIYVGGSVTDGVVGGGTFEQIGTTKTDLTEYAKTADVTETLKGYTAVTTHNKLATRVTIAETTIGTHTTAIAENKAAAEAAQGAAYAAQADVNALEGTVQTLAANVETNKTAAETGISEAKAAAKAADDKAVAAQTDVDALEVTVATLSTIVEANKTAADATQTALETLQTTVATNKTAADATQTALKELQTTVATNKTAADQTQTDLDVAEGKIATIEGTLETLTGTGADSIAAKLATKVDNVTGGSKGITISTADTDDGRVATLAVVPATEVTATADAVVTAATVFAHVASVAETTLTAAKGYTEEKISELTESLDSTVTAENTAISVEQVNGKLTSVSVTKGSIATGDTNLVDGGTVFVVTNALEVAVGKKLDTATYNAEKATADAAIEKAQGDATQALADASTAQTTAEAKIETIAPADARIIVTPATTDKVKSVTIGLADTVATTTDGTAYSKAETDAAVKVASDAAKAADDKAVAAQTAAEAAQTTANGKIAAVEVTADATTHFGAQHISAATDADKKVTITVTRADEWSVGETKPAPGISSVINGKMSNGTTIDDANLVDGTSMFAGNTALTTYVGDLGKLATGTSMFSGCSALTTFCGNLGSLTDGTDMFAGCHLNEESLIYIVDSLPVVTSGTITVGVAEGVDKAPYVTEAATKGWTLAYSIV